MSIFKKHSFEDIAYFESGYSIYGKPMVSVFCYLLDGLLIDTGQRKMQRHILKSLREERVDKIILTHHHEDHTGNAGAIGIEKRIPIFAGNETIAILHKGFKIKPYQKYVFGEIDPIGEVQVFGESIETEKFNLQPIFTPGHSEDHYAFLEKEKGWLFSGDLYIGKLKYMRQDEDIGKMIHSIRKILEYDFEVVFCAHNPRLKKGKHHFKEKLVYLEDFFEKVEKYFHQNPSIASIRKALGRKNDWSTKIWTTNDVSIDFMIRSVIRNIPFK